MYALQKYSNNIYLKIGIPLVVFLGWLVPYLNRDNYEIYEIIFQILIGLIASGLLIVFKNTFLVSD